MGWGTGCLVRDVEEMAQAVEYFRSRTEEGKKVVVMGHSTGKYHRGYFGERDKSIGMMVKGELRVCAYTILTVGNHNR